ncbi:MAG: hypothetical protein J2P58_04635 [Acidimicrobiaceae bacterium]|nr:hypothetical protein [Acidimicrobiaceae bacterium]
MTVSGGRTSVVASRHIIEEFINVGVPHRTAYDQSSPYGEWSKIFKQESAEPADEGGGGTDEVTPAKGPGQVRGPELSGGLDEHVEQAGSRRGTAKSSAPTAQS